MFYHTQDIEIMHATDHIVFEDGTYIVYDSNYAVIAVYEVTFTKNMIINGVKRVG